GGSGGSAVSHGGLQAAGALDRWRRARRSRRRGALAARRAAGRFQSAGIAVPGGLGLAGARRFEWRGSASERGGASTELLPPPPFAPGRLQRRPRLGVVVTGFSPQRSERS